MFISAWYMSFISSNSASFATSFDMPWTEYEEQGTLAEYKIKQD